MISFGRLRWLRLWRCSDIWNLLVFAQVPAASRFQQFNDEAFTCYGIHDLKDLTMISNEFHLSVYLYDQWTTLFYSLLPSRLIYCDKWHQDMQQKIFLTSRKLIFQKCKLYLKKYGHYAWSRRRDLIFSLIIFYFSCKFIFYLWYIKIPKDEPSILCSFGRGDTF